MADTKNSKPPSCAACDRPFGEKICYADTGQAYKGCPTVTRQSVLASANRKYRGTDEAMCNPVFQAQLLNREQVDSNVLPGLCVGHDALFFQFSQVPATVLAVKDRVTGHNPLAAVYQADSCYRKIRNPQRP